MARRWRLTSAHEPSSKASGDTRSLTVLVDSTWTPRKAGPASSTIQTGEGTLERALTNSSVLTDRSHTAKLPHRMLRPGDRVEAVRLGTKAGAEARGDTRAMRATAAITIPRRDNTVAEACTGS